MIREVKISFAGNMEALYSFLTDFAVQIGDIVVCETSRGPSCGKVADLVEGFSGKADKWLIAKVDFEEFFKRRVLAIKEKQQIELTELLG